MKKGILSLAMALLLSFGGMLWNYLSYKNTGLLRWAYRMYGGEITVETGFGLRSSIIYGMTPDQLTQRSLHFAPVNFLITIAVIALAVFVILTGLDHLKARSGR